MSVESSFSLTGPLPQGMTVLEASAGTGKTYAIASLAARLLAEGAASIDQIMMVTFSRMATAELRDRVRRRCGDVESALRQPKLSSSQRDDALLAYLCEATPKERLLRAHRLAEGLARFDDATIATTHEFCSRMLAVLGSLADQDPLAVLAENLDDLVQEACHDVYLSMFADLAQPPLDLKQAHVLAAQAIARHKATLVISSPNDYCQARLELAARVRQEVERRKRERGLFTFDDMLTRLHEALLDNRTGKETQKRIASRYSWVLIDEFQDTDHVQWEIVARAFGSSNGQPSDVNVVLIGDPKQAIYAFRGADVNSYLEAVSHCSQHATLDTNWRSDERMVTALGSLLTGTALGNSSIVVNPINAHVKTSRLNAEGVWKDPVRIRMLPEELRKTRIARQREVMAGDLAADIGAFLASGATLAIEPDEGERPVRYSDIAVLVSRRTTGQTVVEALNKVGIPAVFTGDSSVYESAAAQDWLTLLIALTDPSTTHHRAAALTSLVGWTFQQLACADDEMLSRHSQTLRAWAKVFQTTGMAGLLTTVMTEYNVAARLLAVPDGERRLTDLRHVAHILQHAQARRGLGPTALVDWLDDRMKHTRSNEGEDRSRRLESDADAVTVMTIHRSKGLQFPIVYLPDVGDQRVNFKDNYGPLTVHENVDGQYRIVLDVGGSRSQQRQKRFETALQEQAGEDLRKLYVALTRAQCQVTAWWYPSASNGSRSALHRVLMRDPDATHPELAYFDSRPEHRDYWQGVALYDIGLDGKPVRFKPCAPQHYDLDAATFTRRIDREWRRTSYTGLTAGTHDAVPVNIGLRDNDEALAEHITPCVVPDQAPTVFDQMPSPMADLPGGPQFGSLVHAMLEHADISDSDVETALVTQADHWLARIPVADVTSRTLATALLPSLKTPLGPLAEDRCLAQIPLADRLPELDFEMELAGTYRPRLAHIADLFEQHVPADDPLVEYPHYLRQPGLSEQVLSGFLTGSIDVLMRVGSPSRYVVVDYKTNRVGPVGAPITVGAYTHTAMAQVMMTAHYPLQALLYSVATHRFLTTRLPGYQPERDLGGILYLFVRGMAGSDAIAPDGRRYGVFDWRPPIALVTDLSELLAGKLVLDNKSRTAPTSAQEIA